MDIKFDGKRALITGGSRGIGKEIAKALVKGGAQVVVMSNVKDDLDALKTEIPTIETIFVDLSNWQETKNAVQSALPIDLLVNNAGVAILQPLGQINEKDVDCIFDVNVKALINVTQEVVKGLVNRKATGAIVNISSKAAQAGLENHGAYCASKAAVDGFTRAAAIELGPRQIRINSVNPTVILTDLGRKCWTDPQQRKHMIDKIPLKRFGEVEEVVNAVLFLLSDQARLIHGVCLPVDGGFLAG